MGLSRVRQLRKLLESHAYPKNIKSAMTGDRGLACRLLERCSSPESLDMQGGLLSDVAALSCPCYSKNTVTHAPFE